MTGLLGPATASAPSPLTSILCLNACSSSNGSVDCGISEANARYQSSICSAVVAAKSNVLSLKTMLKHCQS